MLLPVTIKNNSILFLQLKYQIKEVCDASDHAVVKMTQCAAVVGKSLPFKVS